MIVINYILRIFFFFSLILPGINDPVMKIGIPIYTTLLMTMAWRAIARHSALLKLEKKGAIFGKSHTILLLKKQRKFHYALS